MLATPALPSARPHAAAARRPTGSSAPAGARLRVAPRLAAAAAPAAAAVPGRPASSWPALASARAARVAPPARRRAACRAATLDGGFEAQQSDDAAVTPVQLAVQGAAVVAAFGLAFAWLAAAPSSPYAGLPEVIFARKLAVGLFWKVADGIYNPLHLLCVALVNALLAAAAYVLPVVETLPEAVMLAVTELGGLLLDCALVVVAAFKAVALKGVYVAVLLLDAAVGVVVSALVDGDTFIKRAVDWLLAKDPAGLLMALLFARPFTAPAELLLSTTKLAIQLTMSAVETLCALAYATPAALGVALIPTAYIAHAVWRRARRVIIAEPPLEYTVEEFESKVAQLQPLRVPELPILEKQIENEIVGFVNAVGTLQPLRVPPLPNADLAAANAAINAADVSRAQSVDAVIVREPMDTSYSISSSTVVTMATSESYDGLAAVRGAVDAFERTVSSLPPLADERAGGAAEQAAVAAAALSAAEAALAEAEAAFYAIDSPITATTTTVTSMTQNGAAVGGTLKRSVDAATAALGGAGAAPPPAKPAKIGSAARKAAPPPPAKQASGPVGNGPARSSLLKEALIRGVAASLGVAGEVERAAGGTQQVRKPQQGDSEQKKK